MILKKNVLKLVMLPILLGVLSFSCSSDDDSSQPTLEDWEVELEQVRVATSKYADFQVAADEGRIDVSGYVPNMGHHYLNPGLIDGTFDLLNPEFILYIPDENGIMQMVAIEYGVLPEDPNNPGNPPEGFTGDEDNWHFNEMIGEWQLHVWVALDNPDGVFAMFNPVIGD
jgi:hypothetical protein